MAGQGDINGATHAALWNGNSVTDLGTLGGKSSAAYAINNAGQVVGESQIDGNTAYHATLWNGNAPTDLGTILGANNSWAWAINSRAQVAGYSEIYGAGQRATLWNDTTVIDLNTLLGPDAVSAGWVLTDARGINDSGIIVGNAYNTLTHQGSNFLLEYPLPEPGTFALMLSALGLLGLMARARESSAD